MAYIYSRDAFITEIRDKLERDQRGIREGLEMDQRETRDRQERGNRDSSKRKNMELQFMAYHRLTRDVKRAREEVRSYLDILYTN